LALSIAAQGDWSWVGVGSASQDQDKKSTSPGKETHTSVDRIKVIDFFAKLNAMTLGFCARRVVFTVSDPTYIHNLAGTLEML